MQVEITVPLRLKWSGKTVVLEPGQCVELPPAQAEKLLIKGLGKAKTVPLNQWVEFHSPVLGRCTGLVIMVIDEALLLVDHHSVLKAPTTIRVEWVVRVLSEVPRPAPEATP